MNRDVYKRQVLVSISVALIIIGAIFLGWDWHDFIESPKTKEIAPIIMRATDIETNTAVSYTHLDVYKRQL